MCAFKQSYNKRWILLRNSAKRISYILNIIIYIYCRRGALAFRTALTNVCGQNTYINSNILSQYTNLYIFNVKAFFFYVELRCTPRVFCTFWARRQENIVCLVKIKLRAVRHLRFYTRKIRENKKLIHHLYIAYIDLFMNNFIRIIRVYSSLFSQVNTHTHTHITYIKSTINIYSHVLSPRLSAR